MSDYETRDWRRMALTLADALDAAHAEIQRLRGGGLPVAPTTAEPKPAPTDPPMTQPLRGRLERLRKIREGDTVFGPGPTDNGFAVALLPDCARVGLVGAFALTRHYSSDTGIWRGQGPLRTVAAWAAEGWDVAEERA